MAKTVYLCGFMGCGKTTVGNVLAEKLQLGYCDMDAYIEETLGMTIPEIFEEKGEEYFRQQETLAVKALGERGGVIACGGGAMLRAENAEAARGYGRVVFIDVPYEVCWGRIKDDPGRPIVSRNTKESLKVIYDDRSPVYRTHSTDSVDGTGSPEEIAESIAALTAVSS
ncbi:MAG: shikimate kinase [Oscillospiraceae bacterium]|nr:shikimate kinase [Oscillospiraceae bacterium]